MLAATGVLAALLAEPVPQLRGFVEPRLSFVQRREHAQRTFVTGLLEDHLFHRPGGPPRHARRAEVEAELVHRALPELALVTLAQRQRLVHADRPLVLAAAAKHRPQREVRLDIV